MQLRSHRRSRSLPYPATAKPRALLAPRASPWTGQVRFRQWFISFSARLIPDIINTAASSGGRQGGGAGGGATGAACAMREPGAWQTLTLPGQEQFSRFFNLPALARPPLTKPDPVRLFGSRCTAAVAMSVLDKLDEVPRPSPRATPRSPAPAAQSVMCPGLTGGSAPCARR